MNERMGTGYGSNPMDMAWQIVQTRALRDRMDQNRQMMDLASQQNLRQAETHYQGQIDTERKRKESDVGAAVQTITGQQVTPELFPLFGQSMEEYKAGRVRPNMMRPTGNAQQGFNTPLTPMSLEDVKGDVQRNYAEYAKKAPDIARTYGPPGSPEIEAFNERQRLTGTPIVGEKGMREAITGQQQTYGNSEELTRNRALAVPQQRTAEAGARSAEAGATVAENKAARVGKANEMEDLQIAGQRLQNENAQLQNQLNRLEIDFRPEEIKLKRQQIMSTIASNNVQMALHNDMLNQRKAFTVARDVYSIAPTPENFKKMLLAAGLEGVQVMVGQEKAVMQMAERYLDDLTKNQASGLKAAADGDYTGAQAMFDVANAASVRFSSQVGAPKTRWSSVYTIPGALWGGKSYPGSTSVDTTVATQYLNGQLRADTPQNLVNLVKLEAAGLKDDPSQIPYAIADIGQKYGASPEVIAGARMLYDQAMQGSAKIDRSGAEKINVPRQTGTPNQRRLREKSAESSYEGEARSDLGAARLPVTPENIERYKTFRRQGMSTAEATRAMRGQ